MLKLTLLLTLVLPLAPSFASAAKCPVINGHFERIVERDGKLWKQKVWQFTRVEGGVYSYVFDEAKNFMPADGVFRPVALRGRKGKIKFGCEDNIFFSETKADDEVGVYRSEMKPLNASQLQLIETNAKRSGVYTKVSD